MRILYIRKYKVTFVTNVEISDFASVAIICCNLRLGFFSE